jgi:hypothetical protein
MSPLKIDDYHVNILYQKDKTRSSEGYYTATMTQAAGKAKHALLLSQPCPFCISCMLAKSIDADSDEALHVSSWHGTTGSTHLLRHQSFADPSMLTDPEPYAFTDSMSLSESPGHFRLSQCYMRRYQVNPETLRRVVATPLEAPTAILWNGSFAPREQPLVLSDMVALVVQLPPMSKMELDSTRALLSAAAPSQQDCEVERAGHIAHEHIRTPVCLDSLGLLDRHKRLFSLLPLQAAHAAGSWNASDGLLKAMATSSFFPEKTWQTCTAKVDDRGRGDHSERIEPGQCVMLRASLSYHATHLRLVGVHIKRLKVKASDKWAWIACHARQSRSLVRAASSLGESELEVLAQWTPFSIQLIYEKTNSQSMA